MPPEFELNARLAAQSVAGEGMYALSYIPRFSSWIKDGHETESVVENGAIPHLQRDCALPIEECAQIAWLDDPALFMDRPMFS